MKNIMIDGTGAYIPTNKVYNEQLDEHFEKRGLSAHSLMNHLGRRKRYFVFCKHFLDKIAKYFWTLLQNVFGHCCMSKLDKVAKPRLAAYKPAESHCRHYLIVTAQDTETAVPNSHLRVHVP